MRVQSISKWMILAASASTIRAFTPRAITCFASTADTFLVPVSSTRLFSGGSSSGGAEIKHIGWEEMNSLVNDYEDRGREESGLVVIDVRNVDEIAHTGKLSPNTITLPLPIIMNYNLFALDEDDFEEAIGFEKPSPDETLVFSCAAGVRSVHAAKFAAQAGYSKLINYAGGAGEWFRR